jgi:hypothetical protein
VFAGLNSQNGSIASGKIPYAYWFMDQEMKAGDLAVLYTKAGRRSEKTSENGSTSYFFYWGLNSPIWTRSMHRAVLVNTATWAFSKETPQSST